MTKQSNLILGIGIIVALLIIVGSLFMLYTSDPALNTVEQNPGTEIGQIIRQVRSIPISKIANIIKSIP